MTKKLEELLNLPESKKIINEILDSNRITEGKYVAQFENRFAEIIEKQVFLAKFVNYN